jgi:hypothetical protein
MDGRMTEARTGKNQIAGQFPNEVRRALTG